MSNFRSIIEYFPSQKLSDGTVWKESYKEIYINIDKIKYIRELVIDNKLCCVIYFSNDFIYVEGNLKNLNFF